jgi:hypothetical protein
MKRICVSAGLVALGAAAAHAQYAPGLSSMETTKPWALTATIRGFYDDNYLTLPKTIPVGTSPTGATIYGQGARDSYGTELSPSISYNHSSADTLLSATYTYDMKWYNDGSGTTDQTHQFNARMDHEFSERYKLQLNESFVVGQEPQVIDPAVITAPLRISGDNVHNTASVDFTAQLTKLFDVHVGYANSLYAYSENAGDESPPNSFPSYSALLDRIDQTAAVDLRWKALPETTGVLGYQFESLQYTSPELIFFPGSVVNPVNGVVTEVPGYRANSRDSASDFVYGGVDQSFSHNLNGSIRAGLQYLDYYNYGTSSLSPYVDANLTYQYMPQSTAQIGVKTSHNATDVAGDTGLGGTSPVLDEDTTTLYVSVSHRVTSRFTAALMGQAQYSFYNGGGAVLNGLEEDLYLLNLDLAYHFTPWLSGETGYSYTKLNSGLPDRSYARDIVYIGVRATY